MTQPRAMPPAAPRRVSLRFTLAAGVVGLLVAMVAAMLGVGHAVRERTRDATARVLMTALVAGVERDFRNRLLASEAALLELAEETTKGVLDVEQLDLLADDLVSRMRYERDFEWMAFISAKGSGVYVQRLADGQLLRIVGHDDGFTVQEHVNPDGVETPAQTHLVDLREMRDTPWYRLGLQRITPHWSDLYIHPVDHLPGRACALGLQRTDGLVGVFAVGASTTFGSAVLADHWGGRGGGVAMFNPRTGAIGANSHLGLALRVQPLLAAAVAELPQGMASLRQGEVQFVQGRLEGEPVLVGLQPLGSQRSVPAVIAAFIPEADLIGYFRPLAYMGMALVLGLLLVGVAAAVWIAQQVSRPLHRVALDLRRVGSFDISEAPPRDSHIAEVALLEDATHKMKGSLRSFGRYVPKDVVRELMANGGQARLGGTVRTLTIMFTDVKGFTSLAEGQPPQAVVEALGAYFDVLVEAIEAEGGTVDKFVGDGVVAFFNAPRSDDDHAPHACEAALRMQAALAAARAGWRARALPEFPTRIGLHTDAVVVGNIGTSERFGYSVIGDGANYAARLEALNKAYGTWILASRATRDAAPAFEWRRVDRTSVPGRSGGGDVYELLGRRGEVAEAVLAARDAYESAFDAYLARRFADAATRFDRAAALRPDDGAARVLALRARAFETAPPPPAWTGAVTRDQKD